MMGIFHISPLSSSNRHRLLLRRPLFRSPLADFDVSRRKLFAPGLGPEKTTDSPNSLFSTYGELDEAIVISDKTTGKFRSSMLMVLF
ncbi:hypothetical protein BVRB_9g206020 [Beta vulgaris subsp. vulgaris]|uniref:Uncharacterized protein n=1 Tax=Beta vulgaris subsp. vulgaris TaxID=3555 RepID=A0A0J8BQM7_BETVV|nr:hypothetical protein BVRB_9g206020 [Beta vulgaris subsp. vulgaris]